jgi:hypothetical protein
MATMIAVLFALTLSANEIRYNSQNVSDRIAKKMDVIQLCFETAHEKKPGLKGKMVFVWSIDDKGKPQKIKLKSSEISSVELFKCIEKEIKSITFDKAPQGANVNAMKAFIFSSAATPQ